MKSLYHPKTAFVALMGLITLFVLALVSANAYAVPGFSRQTGMTCNQCHTSHGAATPNFTFSGKKFKALGYRLPRVQPPDIRQGVPADRGEYLDLSPVQWSGRFQWNALRNAKPPAGPNAGEWGENHTTPTARFAVFPFIGPIGEHFGVWTEFYIVPSSSGNGEWTIANASYEEHDFRYTFNPGNHTNIFGMALSNQGVGEIFGFGPWPAVGVMSFMDRGGINGNQHPNRATLAAYGWMNDRWAWVLGGFTGDTNTGWDKANVKGMLGYAWQNSNANELWTNIYFRAGEDALPLVTDVSVPLDKHDFYFSDSISGISATRPGACPSDPTFILNGCPYLAEDLDDHSTIEAEVRWSRQNWGDWSFEVVGALGFNTEDYLDGAGTDRDTWGIATQFGWRHTYYIKPYVNGDIDFEFTDLAGTTYDIDTSENYGIYLSYKPVENFLLNFEYHTMQSSGLNRGTLDDGARYAISADISF